MDEQEKQDLFLKELQKKMFLTDAQITLIKLFLSRKDKSLKMVMPRGSVIKRPIMYLEPKANTNQILAYREMIEMECGLSASLLGYSPRSIIIDDLISQIKPTL